MASNSVFLQLPLVQNSYIHDNEPTGWNTIPPDILEEILTRAILPYYVVNISAFHPLQLEYTKEVHFRMGLAVVCRLWHRVAIPLLYRDIVFRRCTRIAYFLETLRSSPSLGQLAKSVMICSLIPPTHYSFLKEQLHEIYRLCPQLKQVEFVPSQRVSGPAIPLLHIPLPNGITHLTLGEIAPFNLLNECLMRVCPNLVFLSFCLLWEVPGEDELSPLSLPALQSLRIFLKDAVDKYLPAIVESWTIPCLEHLSFRSWIYPTERPTCLDFFQKFACNLKSLHIDFQQEWASVQPFLERCPSLTHLMLTDQQMPATLTHHQLQWLDVFPILDLPDTGWIMAAKAQFPSLRGIRVFESGRFGKFPYYHPNFHQLARIIPPNTDWNRPCILPWLPFDFHIDWLERPGYSLARVHMGFEGAVPQTKGLPENDSDQEALENDSDWEPSDSGSSSDSASSYSGSEGDTSDLPREGSNIDEFYFASPEQYSILEVDRQSVLLQSYPY
ncbi:hypothetical protein BDN72DRAFT_205155 [Pluteus cervinus]|uniref:Uncharacterized protein n=1 Tax=Pluteus cervinus TaxID=181527 RepID=A0ACD3AID9_9AGAR|nr:hypothetical protein BDN72DRAFT_205155 [Pluteus cervinus]